MIRQLTPAEFPEGQIFSTDFAFPLPQSKLVSRPVIIHHPGMVDGNVRRTLIKIGDGIATSLH